MSTPPRTHLRKSNVIVSQGTLHIDGRDPITVSQRLNIGRSGGSRGLGDGASLLLPDPEISSVHCTFDSTSKGIVLEDAGSLNGTFVNEISVMKAVLDKDCTIQLGGTRIEFRVAGPRIETVTDRFGDLVGRSLAMRNAFARLQRIADSDIAVILRGETGTGKDLAARAIHELGPRKEGPFVVVDCTTIPANLAEAELFGVCRGAFTGAVKDKPGLFELANGGTIFLDEIGELDTQVQAKLLRVLEERTCQRVGGTKRRKLDVRVLAGTLRDLRTMVNHERFRVDLYFRFSTEVPLPALREHPEDIPLLIKEFCRASDKKSYAPAAIAYVANKFGNHHWPGNVRELRQVVSGYIALGEEFDHPGHDLYKSPFAQVVDREAPMVETHASTLYEEAKAEFERKYFNALYVECTGNKSKMARLCGMKRETVKKKLREYEIER